VLHSVCTFLWLIDAFFKDNYVLLYVCVCVCVRRTLLRMSMSVMGDGGLRSVDGCGYEPESRGFDYCTRHFPRWMWEQESSVPAIFYLSANRIQPFRVTFLYTRTYR
jgi:hypothetical protein